MIDKATDKRPQFILIEDVVVEKYDLDPYTGWLYVMILKHANKKTGEAFPGIARLAKLCNMSRSQVMRGITTLESKELIRVERDTKPMKGEKRQRTVNHYYVLPVSNQGVVSGSDYPSVSQQLGVVSDSDINQNHKEPESVEVIAPENELSPLDQKAQADVFVRTWLKAAGRYSPLAYDHAKAVELALPLVDEYTLEDVRLCTATQCKNRPMTNLYHFSYLVKDLVGFKARRIAQAPTTAKGLDAFSQYRLEMMQEEKARKDQAAS